MTTYPFQVRPYMVRVGRLGINLVLLANLAAVLVAHVYFNDYVAAAFFGMSVADFTRTTERPS
jgi:hypothetical protein